MNDPETDYRIQQSFEILSKMTNSKDYSTKVEYNNLDRSYYVCLEAGGQIITHRFYGWSRSAKEDADIFCNLISCEIKRRNKA